MKSLNKKLFRDIWRNKAQFLSIFLMTFLGILCFSGIHSYMDGMRVSGEEYYKNQNLQDLIISGENFEEKDLDEIKKISNIKDAERNLNISATLDGFDDVTLDTIFLETNNISKFYVVEGEGFDKERSGVWFDSYLAKNLGIKVGDEITIVYKTYELKEKVLGLICVPDHVYSIKDDTAIFPTHKDYGFAYMSINEFPIDYYVFNQILVDVDNTEKLQDTKQEIENKIKSAIAVTTREDMASYQAYQSEIEEGETYSKVFTALFLFIAILSVITTMYRFIRKQRMQIGTMKALRNKKKENNSSLCFLWILD